MYSGLGANIGQWNKPVKIESAANKMADADMFFVFLFQTLNHKCIKCVYRFCNMYITSLNVLTKRE